MKNTTELLSQQNKIIDMPGLNRFRIGDHVIAEACADHDRFEGIVIGIDLHRAYAGPCLEPSITILHDGDQITDGFQPNDLSHSAAPSTAAAPPPVDRSAVQLTNGAPVTGDHRTIDPASGQQKGYVVLTAAERAKGFVRPYRDAYRHLTCKKITTMGHAIAETYARDPHFYSGTFCTTCRNHFPVGEDGEFTWYEMDGSEGPKVGT